MKTNILGCLASIRKVFSDTRHFHRRVALSSFALLLMLGLPTDSGAQPARPADRPASDAAHQPAPAVIDREINFFHKRLEDLRKEATHLKERGASEQELASLRERIAQTERHLKQWETRKAQAPQHRPADARRDAASAAANTDAARLHHLRIASEHLHEAGMHELAKEVDSQINAIENKLRQAAASKTPDAAAPKAAPPPAPLYASADTRPPREWLQPVETKGTALGLFEKRILPIFHSPKPSSCTECHLSGVELKDYIFPSQEQTFAALVKGGYVDVKSPDQSKILHLIGMGANSPNLITEEMRKQEFDAFRAWIHAAVKDPKLLAAKPPATAAGPSLSDEVIRHARTDRVLASFLENIWSEMNRCDSCHSPEKNQRQAQKHGDFISWVKPGDPMGTLQKIVDSGFINLEDPARSLLVTKPTMEEDHAGGLKMMKGDRSYRQFLTFLKDYSAIIKGQYTSAAQLPKPDDEVSRAVAAWLRVTDIPAQFAKKPLQVDVYAWTDSGWGTSRVATGTWPVIEKGLFWQFHLTLTGRRETQTAESLQLKPGRYLVKIYVDQHSKLQKDGLAKLGEEEFVGQVEVQTEWKLGAPKDNATIIRFPAAQTALRKDVN